VHLVGFIVRIYDDARSPERKIWKINVECITVVKVLCYKSEGRWFDPSWCQ